MSKSPSRYRRRFEVTHYFNNIGVIILVDIYHTKWVKATDLMKSCNLKQSPYHTFKKINSIHKQHYKNLRLKNSDVLLPYLQGNSMFISLEGLKIFAENYASLQLQENLDSFVKSLNPEVRVTIPVPEQGYFFIASTQNMMNFNIYLIDCAIEISKFLATHNSSRLSNDQFFVVFTSHQTPTYERITECVKYALAVYRESTINNLFKCEYQTIIDSYCKFL